MPDFLYLARDEGGRTLRGTGAAADASAMAAQLRSRGQMVLEVVPAPAAGGMGANDRSLRSLETENGLRQISSMIRGGLTLLEALRAVAEQAGSPRAGRVWHEVARRIEHGSTLADAMAGYPRAFGSHVVELIRVGESSGNLEQSMQRAADHLERTRELRVTVINALAYPVIVTILAIAVAAFLVLVVIPKLQKYLGERGRELPQLTTTLLEVSAAVQTSLPYLAIGLVAGAIALVMVRRWPPGKLAIDRLVLRLPLVGMIFRLAATATVARGLGILIESGVTLLDALAATARLPSNEVVRARLTTARDLVMRGSALAVQLDDRLAFMPMLPRMVAVGEQAGTLTHVLDEVARFSDRQLVSVIRRMSVLVEPVVILVVGGIVGFVYIAFFLALFALAGNIR